MGDVRLDLEEAAARDIHAAGTSPRPRLASSAAIALAGGTLVIGTLIGALVTRTSPETPTVRVLSAGIPAGDLLGMPRGTPGSSIALSPSGDALVYVATRDGVSQLFHRPLDRADPIALPGTTGALQPFYSPDGRRVAFFADGLLKTYAFADQRLTTVCEAGLKPFGGTWLNEEVIAYAAEAGIHQVAAAGGAPRSVAAPQSEGEILLWPTYVPGTNVLAFEVNSAGRRHVALQAINGGPRQRLVEDASFPRYVDSTHLAFYRGAAMWVVPFDLERLVLTGEAFPILQDIAYPVNASAEFATSSAGTLAYVRSTSVATSTERGQASIPVWVDRSGRTRGRINTSPGVWMDPRLSPDGHRLTVSKFFPLPTLTMMDLDSGGQRPLADDVPGGSGRALWSADGRELIYGSTRGGNWNIYARPSNGELDIEEVTSGSYRMPTSLTPDGEGVLFRSPSGSGDWHVGIAWRDRSRPPELLLHTAFNEHSAAMSPDGRWMAYVSDDAGREEVYLLPFPGPGRRVTVSANGGSEPLWRPDGRELFYRGPASMMAVSVTPGTEFRVGRPEPLFEDRFVRGMAGRPWTNYDVTKDGQTFLMMAPDAEAVAGGEITVVLNWTEALKRVMPR
jgi:Tol biopolymer transport system component